MRKQKPIHGLSDLPEDQRELLREWLETTTPYTEIAKRVLDQFGVKTNESKLGRMRQRFRAEEQTEAAAENLETIGELMDQGVLANTQYKPVTLKLVEKRLFEHALDPKSDTKVLKNLAGILDHHERRQLESRRLDLREREVILKETAGTARISRAEETMGTARVSRANEGVSPEQSSETSVSPEHSSEAKPARTWRVIKPYKSSIEPLWLECGENKEKFLEAMESKFGQPNYVVTALFSPDWSPEKNEAMTLACERQAERHRQIEDEQNRARRGGTHPCVPVSAASCPADSAPPTPSASELLEASTTPKAGSSLSLQKGEGQGEGSISVQQSTTCPTTAGISNQALKLESSVRSHLTRRALEWQRNGKNTRATIYRECPCGNATPCKEHGEFPEWFWQCSPWNGDLALAMIDRGLPYMDIKLQSEEAA
jgi:hypothetical protein